VALHRSGETDANGFVESFNGRLRDERLGPVPVRQTTGTRTVSVAIDG
jgi:hypothetical protein